MRALPSACLLLAALLLPASIEAKTWRIVFLPKEAGGEYWDAVHAGALKAKADGAKDKVDIDLVWTPPVPDAAAAAGQIASLTNAVVSHPDGIVLAPVDPALLRPPAEAAAQGGISVVAIDTPLSSPFVKAYIGTNNFEAGQEAAGFLGKLMGGRGGVLIVGDPDRAPTIAQREKGFIDGMQIYPNIQPLFSGDFAAAIPAVVPDSAAKWAKHFANRLNGVFTADPESFPLVAQALQDPAVAQAQAIHVVFGARRASVEALRNGTIQGIIADNPFQIGYQAVRTLAASLQGTRVPLKTNINVFPITKDKLGDAELQQLINPPVAEFLNPAPASAPAPAPSGAPASGSGQ